MTQIIHDCLEQFNRTGLGKCSRFRGHFGLQIGQFLLVKLGISISEQVIGAGFYFILWHSFT